MFLGLDPDWRTGVFGPLYLCQGVKPGEETSHSLLCHLTVSVVSSLISSSSWDSV